MISPSARLARHPNLVAQQGQRRERVVKKQADLVSARPAIQRTLASSGLAREGDEEGTYEFFCTGPVSSFGEVATRFLQMPLGDVRQVKSEGLAITPDAAL